MIGGIRGRVGEPLVIAGYANDYDKRIRAVQFSLDDGETWTTYETPGTVPDLKLLVRSVNEDGVASPTPARVDFWVE